MNHLKHRHCYTIAFKRAVIEYTREHSNRAAEQQFGLPPTGKMIRTWRQQEQQLKEANPNNRNLRRGPAIWPELLRRIKNMDIRSKKIWYYSIYKNDYSPKKIIGNGQKYH
jgi:hypothetical protein